MSAVTKSDPTPRLRLQERTEEIRPDSHERDPFLLALMSHLEVASADEAAAVLDHRKRSIERRSDRTSTAPSRRERARFNRD